MPAKKTQSVAADEKTAAGGAGYTVNSPLRFNGERYRPGDVIEMSDADAEPLLADGLIAKP